MTKESDHGNTHETLLKSCGHQATVKAQGLGRPEKALQENRSNSFEKAVRRGSQARGEVYCRGRRDLSRLFQEPDYRENDQPPSCTCTGIGFRGAQGCNVPRRKNQYYRKPCRAPCSPARTKGLLHSC